MQVECIFQGKGGVGKTFIATLLSQYFSNRGIQPLGIDSDPQNATFASYKAIGAEILGIMEGDEINPRLFDKLVEKIIEKGGEGKEVAVIDNGASSFIPLCSYIIQNGFIEVLAEAGHTVRIHNVVAGGDNLADTMQCFVSLAKAFPHVPMVVWLNEHFGPTSHHETGKSFEESKAFKDHGSNVHSLIKLPSVKPETYGQDMRKMMSHRLTFAEALVSPNFTIMERQRLKMVWRNLEGQMDRAKL